MDYKRAKKVLIFTLLLNWAVSAAKLIYGVMTRSESMTADGFHSFADGTNNIIGLAGLSIAARPIDKNHPYGHQKYENLTALGIGVLLSLVALDIFQHGIGRLKDPVTPEVNAVSFIVMIVGIAINVFVMTYEKREGEKLKSDILISDSMHTRSDILVSISVIMSLIAVKLGLPLLDTLIAIVIALLIGWTAARIFWETSRVLSDAAMLDPEKIRVVVENYNEVAKCHKIRSRGRKDNISVDLHIHVKPTMTIEESHELSHSIEAKLKDYFQGVTEVIVHLEPTLK